MKNSVYINNIIKAVFVLMLLIFVFIKNDQLYFKLFILAFIILIICNIAKNICNLCNKPKLANILHKLYIFLFILFLTSFLIIMSYFGVKHNQYFLSVFTIPFWLGIIYIIRKHLLKIKKKSKQNKINFPIVISSLLVVSVLLIGVVCLFIGIKDIYKTNQLTKNYLITTAHYKDYEIYDSSEENITYRLIYVYKVDDKEYEIKTDYGNDHIPSANSERKIKYNPINPSKAVFLGTSKNSMLIYFGAFFLLGGIVFVLIFFYIKGAFDKIKINILGLYVGVVFLIIGIGIIAIKMGEGLSFLGVIEEMKFWLSVPIIFIIIGIFQICKCLFFERIEIGSNKK